MQTLPTTADSRHQQTVRLLNKVAQAVRLLEEEGTQNGRFTEPETELIAALETTLAVQLAILSAIRELSSSSRPTTDGQIRQNIALFSLFD